MNHTVRCLAWAEGDGSWQSLCVELSLSAHAPTLPEAKRRLSIEIRARLGHADHVRLVQLPWHRRWLVPVVYALAPTLRMQRYRETIPAGFASIGAEA